MKSDLFKSPKSALIFQKVEFTIEKMCRPSFIVLFPRVSVCLCVYICVFVCVCVSLLNQCHNSRFTAPACQDSLLPQGFHHLPARPVETEIVEKYVLEECKTKEQEKEGKEDEERKYS